VNPAVLAWLRDLRGFVAARVSATGTPPPGTPPDAPADPRLDRALALTPPQRGFLWTSIAAAIDPLLHPYLLTVGGADGRRGLSVATYAALVGCDPDTAVALAAWLAGRPPVMRLGLLVAAIEGLAASATPFVPAPRLCTYVAGLAALDPDVDAAGGLITAPVAPRHDAAQAAVVSRLDTLLAARDPALIVLAGPHGVGRRAAIALAAARHGRAALALDAERVPAPNLVAAVGALVREALLQDAVPVVANVAVGIEDGESPVRGVGHLLDELPVTCVITTRDEGLEVRSRRPVRRVVMPVPDTATRLALWRDALAARGAGDALAPEILQELALSYRVGAGGVADAVTAAVTEARGPLDRAALVAGVRSSVADRFGGLAERLEPHASWDDAVLAADTRDQVRALIGRVRHAYRVFEEWRFPRDTARGGGVAALFSGPPGTGKTLVAGLCARELGRDLYRVDLSKIVSKWVGETEKQLGQVFEAAEAGHTLLLFDEADALFARRTEVKSSSDRYANLEVNYLLQRIETFGGVTILTTNLDASIDPALRRRLAAHIVFWPPDTDERIALWRRFLTGGVPHDGTADVDELAARFPDMTGANIRNAVLAAAFLAAERAGPLTHDLLERAARAEYRSMGRVIGGAK